MLNKIRPLYIFSCFCLLISISACKKTSESPVVYIVDKSITLNETHLSVKDSLLVTRADPSVNLKVYANTKGLGTKKIKRLYIFGRHIDDVNSPSEYRSVYLTGFVVDANNQFYFPIGESFNDSTINTVTLPLRAYSFTAMADEYYFVYTEDVNYAGPSSTDGVVIGPARFVMIYGKLTEYPGKRIYNIASYIKYHYPAFNVAGVAYLYAEEPMTQMDIFENTDNNPLFLGKFKSLNGTTFVKAPNNFSYATATDVDIAKQFSLGVPFTETPDSVKIGDVYLINIRQSSKLFAAMKIMYVEPETGEIGNGQNNEYFVFNLKR